MTFDEKFVARRLEESGVATSSTLTGCSEEQIADVMRMQSVDELPSPYVSFLRAAGIRSGDLLRGSDLQFPKLLEFKTDAGELVEEWGNGIALPTNSFVFAFHQGYTFLWFPVDSSEQNPAVFAFSDDQPIFKDTGLSFSEWFELAIRDSLA